MAASTATSGADRVTPRIEMVGTAHMRLCSPETRIRFSNSSRHSFAISRPDMPELCRKFPCPRSEGAGNAGCTLHPRSRAQQCTKKRTRAYRFSGGNPAFPAQWFYGLYVLSPVTGLFCHCHRRLPANLMPASGHQDHTTSPSASHAVRYRRLRVHRIPLHVRDDRERPSDGAGRVRYRLICDF